MSTIIIQTIPLKYSRPAPNNIDVYDVEEIVKMVPYKSFEHRMVEFQPKSYAANHSHAHKETLCAFGGELTLYYVDENGTTQKNVLNTIHQAKSLITIPAYMKHAVVNHSQNPSTLMYWTDIVPQEAQPAQVFDPSIL